jgi:hypothetical protein
VQTYVYTPEAKMFGGNRTRIVYADHDDESVLKLLCLIYFRCYLVQPRLVGHPHPFVARCSIKTSGILAFFVSLVFSDI